MTDPKSPGTGPFLTIKKDPEDREADRAETLASIEHAERLSAESITKREDMRREEAQKKMDQQISADGDRLAKLVRTPGLLDEELDAILAYYHERYTHRRSYMAEGVTGSFGSVLRRALVSA